MRKFDEKNVARDPPCTDAKYCIFGNNWEAGNTEPSQRNLLMKQRVIL